MLSKNYRLRLTEIACRVRLGKTTTLSERIWMHKLCEHNAHARGIIESIMCPDKLEPFDGL